MAEGQVSRREPRFSFVVAVYGVEAYLGAFLASLDTLDVAPADLEVVFVDDGSPDGSVGLIQPWISSSRFAARLVRQANGGPGSARNAGLDLARGRWVSFPDPDDVLTPDYLQVVAGFLDGDRVDDVALVASRPIRFVDDAEVPTAPHPLDFKYEERERVVDLDRSPRFVHLHTITGFFRRDVIAAYDLRFDPRVRPVFEDAAFIVGYLSRTPRPTVAFLREARYLYRRRADAGSLTGSAWQDRRMFDQLPEHGYLGVLERFSPDVPRWVQNTVYYDLQWFFKADARFKSDMVTLTGPELTRFHALLDRVLSRLDEATLLEFHAIDIPVRVRLALLARKTGRLPAQQAFVTKLDRARRLVQLSYFSSVPDPDEEVRADGEPVVPAYAKTTAIRYFGRTWLYQRDLWVGSGRPVSLRIDGRTAPIVYGPPSANRFETSSVEVWRRFASQPPPAPPSPDPDPAEASDDPVRGGLGPHLEVVRQRWRDQTERPLVQLTRRLVEAAGWSVRLSFDGLRPVGPRDEPRRGLAGAVRRRAESPRGRRRFGEAWILLDRDTSAQDNAEAFYRYLQQHHPEVNAWFALSRRAPDWSRLERDGFRLLDFDSVDYAVALRNATYLISSQADDYVVRPPRGLAGRRTWQFVFLQHGVIHNDLSRWLNTRPIRVMITTTRAEHTAIVGDGSPYLLSEKEVERTGLPRHDTLLRKARHAPADRRRLLLVTPTWRDYLLGPQVAGARRELVSDLANSTFLRGWLAFLTHPALPGLLRVHDLDLVLLAHPHLQPHLDPGLLPPYVTVRGLDDGDLQDLIVRARVLVTDYSSIAFDAAYLDVPVLYHQFDADEFFSGRHTVRPGAFSYKRDGFGPVTAGPDEAVAALTDLLDPGSARHADYRRRAAEAFTFRDGRCSERVYDAIRRREQPEPAPVVDHDRVGSTTA